MKTALALLGAFHLLMFAAGTVGYVDYHLCLKGPGECGCIKEQSK